MIKEFFTLFDVVSAIFMLLIVVVHANWRRGRHMEEEHFRYFLPSLYFKLVLGLTFALFYVIAYNGGGDTVAYWSGGVRLSNLFFESPGEYFTELFRGSERNISFTRFNRETGYPPLWIYYEDESWLVCKLLSVQVILTFKGFFAGTVLMIYMAHAAVWKLFEKILTYRLFSLRNLALAMLFIPSVNFWCSGISKDTLLFTGMCLFTSTFFSIVKQPGRPLLYLVLFVLGWYIYHIRAVMLFTVAVPVIAVLSRKVLNNKDVNWVLRAVVGVFSVGLVAFSVAFVFSNGSLIQSQTVNNLVSEAAIIQQDFSNNVFYGDKKYDLGVTDFSITGMVAAFPAAVMAGLYRPFFWEALSPSLIFNGIESLVLIWLTVRFIFRRQSWKRFLDLFRHELLVYFIITVFFIAFFAGFTSVLFGVLVRIRAFALPFLFLLLTHESNKTASGED